MLTDQTSLQLTDQTLLQLTLDVVGIFAFALSGAVVAVRARLDIFGVLVLAGSAGLGGGILRDVLLGATPPQGVTDPWYLGSVVAAALVTFLFHAPLERVWWLVDRLDAVGLAAFTATGAMKALNLGAPPITAIILGTITAVGGGMLRDLLAGQVPQVLSGQYYALPSLAGGTVLVLLHQVHLLTPMAVWAIVAGIFLVRIIVIRLDVHAPIARLVDHGATAPRGDDPPAAHDSDDHPDPTTGDAT
ncbi:trimeric intracellular cation channel family protein [Kribbia dieselivorans]|uniref:trimeric intracellular cation channel family protein n=1 Tax=Kribbia dieselivorans TaxID=331526 RepID=UPI0009FAFE91|nr:trimeric intracellular cation channel family protein [Kribbia dieselivorans]